MSLAIRVPVIYIISLDGFQKLRQPSIFEGKKHGFPLELKIKKKTLIIICGENSCYSNKSPNFMRDFEWLHPHWYPHHDWHILTMSPLWTLAAAETNHVHLRQARQAGSVNTEQTDTSIVITIISQSYLASSIYLSIYLCIHLPIYLSICLSIYLSIYPSTYLSIDLSICLYNISI